MLFRSFPNLDAGLPVIWQMLYKSTYMKGAFNHIVVVDGYADQDYQGGGNARYIHTNWGLNGKFNDLWINVDKLSDRDDSVKLVDGAWDNGEAEIAPVDPGGYLLTQTFLYNIMSDDAGKEILSGRIEDIYQKDSPTSHVAGLVVTFTDRMGNAYSTLTDNKGVFILRVPSNTVFRSASIEGEGIETQESENSLGTILGASRGESAAGRPWFHIGKSYCEYSWEAENHQLEIGRASCRERV